MNYLPRIRTRTTHHDYFWVGGDPDEWWTRGWGDSLLRRKPCMLKRGRGDGGSILITGIPSGRRDGSTSRTQIRYDLAFEPDPAGPVTEEELDNLVAAWWRGDRVANRSGASHRLGTSVDDALRQEAGAAGTSVDSMLENARTGPLDPAVTRAVAAVVKAPSSSTPLATRNQPEKALDPSAILAVGSSDPDIEWLLRGPTSVAYFAFLDSEALGEPLGLSESTVIIVDGLDGRHPRPKEGLGPRGHGPPLLGRDRTGADRGMGKDPDVSGPGRPVTGWVALGVVLVLLALMLVLVLGT